jgi:signal transduction histidine kinase
VLRSLRSKLILASFLWTLGLLALMHMFSVVVIHVFPRVRTSHAIVGPILAGLGGHGRGCWLAPGPDAFPAFAGKADGRSHGREIAGWTGKYPSEVQPLIDDLNALLEDREKAVKRAVATAGDLAHGLKTPLALLAQEADRAEAAGRSELAASISQHVERMSRQVNYHLARARAAASGAVGTARCPVAPRPMLWCARCWEALRRPRARHLVNHRAGPLRPGPTRGSRRNARQPAGQRMQMGQLQNRAGSISNRARMLVLTVDDDGPGLAAIYGPVVLERGVRVDEAAPGSGLGLAIVRDLAELYGGSISVRLAESWTQMFQRRHGFRNSLRPKAERMH